MALTSDPSLRSNVRERTKNPFDPEERDRVLGGSQAIQGQISNLAGGLNFDIDAQRQSRTNLIERSAEEERNRLGRLFALSPSGIQQGRAVRGFGTVGAARLNALDQLESGLQTEALTQNRANIGALQGILGQQQQGNLAAGSLGLQALGQAQQFTGQEGAQALAERQTDIQQQAQDRSFGLQERGLGLQEEILRGQLGLAERGQTLAETTQREDIGFRREATQQQLDIQRQQIAVQADQFAQGFGLSTDQFLEAKRQFDAGQTLGNAQLEEGIRQFNESLGLQERAQSFAEEVQTGQLDLSERSLNESIAARIEGQSIQERGLDLQSSIESGRMDLAHDQLTENRRQFNKEKEIQIQQIAAQLGIQRDQFEEVKRQFDAGEINLDEQTAEQIRQFDSLQSARETEFNTTIGEQQRQFDTNMTNRRQEFSAQFGLQEAQIFGGGPAVTYTQEAMQDAFGAKQGDPNYREDLDLNGDGEFDFSDFIELSANGTDLGNGMMQFIPDDGRRTLAQQQLDTQQGQFAQQFGLQEEQVGEAIRQFDTQVAQQAAQFLSNFSGVAVNEFGGPRRIWDPDTKEWKQPTSLQRESFEEAKTQFDEQMNQSAQQFAEKMGLQWDQMNNAEKMSIAGMVIQGANVAGNLGLFGGRDGNATGGGGLAGSIGSGASIGAALGSIVPGIGTAVGGIIGGVGGFFKGLF